MGAFRTIIVKKIVKIHLITSTTNSWWPDDSCRSWSWFISSYNHTYKTSQIFTCGAPELSRLVFSFVISRTYHTDVNVWYIQIRFVCVGETRDVWQNYLHVILRNLSYQKLTDYLTKFGYYSLTYLRLLLGQKLDETIAWWFWYGMVWWWRNENVQILLLVLYTKFYTNSC